MHPSVETAAGEIVETELSPESALDLKISCLARGVRVLPSAKEHLSRGGRVPLSIHEYPTTGGVTFILRGDVFINAPFDEWFCESAEARLDWDKPTEQFVVRFRGEAFPVSLLPLPGYLGTQDDDGTLVSRIVMSHADRARLSPLNHGCAFSCKFCDLAAKKYTKYTTDKVLRALSVAKSDNALPVRHVLVSGGTSNASDQPYFDEIVRTVVHEAGCPVDVMMTPRREIGFVDEYAGWGLKGFSLNLEVFAPEVAKSVAPEKARLGLETWARAIRRAVDLTGGHGRVRSLLVVGLEPLESTLAGVEFLARLGCDPVISPFRPAQGIQLSHIPPPSEEFLRTVFTRGSEIAHQYGVLLGPRCIPCQNNVLAVPIGQSGYYFS